MSQQLTNSAVYHFAGRGVTLLKLGAMYMVLGLAMGIAMGVRHDYSLVSVHAHMLLLGWAALSITGIAYILLPQCAASRLAAWHFWLHNLGLPPLLISLALFNRGFSPAEKTLAAGSTIVLASFVFFGVNLYRNARPQDSAASAAHGA